MTIRTKLLTTLSVILLSAFVIMSLINYMFTKQAVREELLTTSLPLTGKNIYSEIHTALMRPILVSSSMATDSFLKGWVANGEQDVDKITKYLEEIQEKYGFLTAFYVSAVTDNYYYPGGILKKIYPREPRDVWYYAFIRSGEEYDLNVDISMQDEDKLTIFVNYRMVDDNGKLLGVVGVGVNMDKAVTLLRQTKERYGREVYLVDRDGWVQVHSDKSRIERMYITEEPGIRDVAAGILTPHAEAMNFEYDKNGRHILLSTHFLPEFTWYLVVEQDEDAALAHARDNLFRTLGIGLAVSILIILLCSVAINSYQTKLEQMATTDPLTGSANRRALEHAFSLAAYRFGRSGEPFSIAIIDLDKFKSINDRLGHLAGDSVLKQTADGIARTIRPTDMLARWGGDEFIILMPGLAHEAKTMVARIRERIEDNAGELPVSFSCGIAQFEHGDNLNSVTMRADKAMYDAKKNGGQTKIAVATVINPT